MLWNPANAVFQQQHLKEAKEAAAGLRMQLQLFEARSAAELDRSVRAIVAAISPPALLVLGDPVFVTAARQIADLALQYRLPSVSGRAVLAEAGLLMTYSPDYQEAFRRAAGYVDRIIKGDSPADLAVERSARFELVVNTITAGRLGLTLPQSLCYVRTDVVKHYRRSGCLPGFACDQQLRQQCPKFHRRNRFVQHWHAARLRRLQRRRCGVCGNEHRRHESATWARMRAIVSRPFRSSANR